ncbi:MAG TPA: DUF779 domain-containing protein [Ktedonobacteraceae bacterium]|nr:DUF779 domain-containing protein [Ktedonobacteraceae bacterium]
MSETVIATDAARDQIARLKARYGSLMFVQSGGCCDGSSPICLREGELLLSPNDQLIGEIDGCPFYIDREQYERWRKPQFLVDVETGEGDSFSLEGPLGLRFVARTQGETGPT